MWKKVAIGVGAVVVVFVVVVVTRPSEFRVERSTGISAPPEVVFDLINDFHAWSGWSPWEKLDPEMKRTFSGAESGVGATYAWTGNDQVGSGEMTITESQSPSAVGIALRFKEPWEAENATRFEIVPKGGQVKVSWEMKGQSDFVGKAMGMFMDMDALVGRDFEKGLASMKALAEAKAEAEKQKAAEATAERAAEEAASRARADAEAAAMEDAQLPMP
jgi:hypothetical protein